MDKTADDRVVAQPAAWFRLPPLEGIEPAFTQHPRLLDQGGVTRQDQVGQGPTTEVAGTDTLPATIIGRCTQPGGVVVATLAVGRARIFG